MSRPRILRTSSTASTSTPRDGRTSDLIDPATGEVVRARPRSRGRPDVDRAYARPPSGVRGLGRDARPTRAAAARCSGSPTRSRRAPTSSSRSRSRTPASRSRLDASARRSRRRSTRSGSSPAPPGILEGRRAGEYMAGHTSFDPARAGRRVSARSTPWNYPLMMAVWKFAPALAAGNTVVLKPSRHHARPRPLLLGRDRRRVPARRACSTSICGDRDTGRALVEHPTPQMVVDHRLGARRHGGRRARRPPTSSASTSSSAARRRSSCSTTPTSRRPPRASPVAGYFNAGQDCTAATRVLAGPGVHDDFVAALAEQAEATPRPACPTTRTSLYGPLNNAEPARRGSRASSTGCPTTPTVVAGGTASGRRAATSTSRPCVAGLRPGRRDDPERDLRPGHHRAAVHRRGRGARAGPTASSTAWRHRSGPRTTAARCGCRKRLDFGCVWINTHIPLVAEMPHGGFKHSGYGKDLSMYGFEDYTRIKHVMANIESLTPA